LKKEKKGGIMDITAEWFILIVVTVIFILSLAGAFILFKFLKSFALIKKVGYQAGGAIAGFLLIYGALYYSFDNLLETVEVWKPKTWAIVGMVKRQNDTKHESIRIKHIPPRPSTLTDESGSFRLENVRVIRGEGWPEIYFESDGYYPMTYPIIIKKENAVLENIKRENAVLEADKKKINLKGIIKIIKKTQTNEAD
jgi:hypothetical protein